MHSLRHQWGLLTSPLARAALVAHSELDCRAGEAGADGPTWPAGNVFAEQAANILKELDL